MTLTPSQEELCAQDRWDLSDARALLVSGTHKRSPEVSHTDGVYQRAVEVMRHQGVAVESIRTVDRHISTGVWPVSAKTQEESPPMATR